ncbi:protein DJ-1alpha [Trichonephila clavipes]|nr:protein DJ-1alpha [Trichonephila clavipes]
MMENRRLTNTELINQFPRISRSFLHEIVTKHLLFKKLCARWVPENLTSQHKIQRLGAAVTFLQRYHDDGDEFLDSTITGDETAHLASQAMTSGDNAHLAATRPLRFSSFHWCTCCQ